MLINDFNSIQWLLENLASFQGPLKQNVSLSDIVISIIYMENRILIHDSVEMNSPRDWRKALKKPPAYRIINRTFGFRNKQYFYKMISYIGLTALLGLIVIYYIPGWTSTSGTSNYNNTYPLTAPVKANNIYTYRIGKLISYFL